jgi:hypothetical protein
MDKAANTTIPPSNPFDGRNGWEMIEVLTLFLSKWAEKK